MIESIFYYHFRAIFYIKFYCALKFIKRNKKMIKNKYSIFYFQRESL